jgi:hypothetical protein
MQMPIRLMVLGLLVSFCAMPVRGQQKAPDAAVPGTSSATQQSTPLNLSLPPATAPQPSQVDSALLPSVVPQTTSTGLAPNPAAALPSAVAPQATTGLAPNPAAAQAPVPIDPLQSASSEVQSVARWVSASRDNAGMPFMLIDKVNAQVYTFNRSGQLQGAAPVLLGMAKGDRMLAPNDAPMSAMPPSVRITPAGRFVSRLGIDSKGKELLILDYDASLSLHPVVKGKPAERRAERLNSASAQDNRISFGCINVPTVYYSSVVSPTFAQTKGIVYVLPETKPASEQFGFQPGGGVAVPVPGAQQISTALGAGSTQAVQAPGTK